MIICNLRIFPTPAVFCILRKKNKTKDFEQYRYRSCLHIFRGKTILKTLQNAITYVLNGEIHIIEL